MQKVVLLGLRQRKKGLSAFTIVEMLTVITIIAILAALTIGTGSAVLNASKRNRAKTEIAGMGAAMENYKIDNGSYPGSATMTLPYPLDPVVASLSSYQTASEVLFSALFGQSNFTNTAVATATSKTYYNFKANQVGVSGSASYAQDPWNNPYGYSTGASSSSNTYSGVGFFDIWSTAGSTTSTNGWVANWNN